jgi:predicted dehydrogenase
VRVAEAETLVRLAEQNNLKLTAGHDDQFSPAARRMRDLIDDGYLGAPPLHLDSYYGYELTGDYARALLGDRHHWVRTLPGGLLHNVISHGIARIAEYIQGDSPSVIAHGFTSPFLRGWGETQIVDELRMIVSDRQQVTAYFTFSTQMRPSLHQFRVFGSKRALLLDEDEQVVIKLRGTRFKSYAEKFLPPFHYAGQYLGNAAKNARLFLANDFHMKSGMKFLIEAFYHSIREGTAAPIPYREIVLTARIMEEAFTQICSPYYDREPVASGRESALSNI